MNGILYLLNGNNSAFAGVADRKGYSSLKGHLVFSAGCGHHCTFQESYKMFGYPLGKSVRGFKKWHKKLFGKRRFFVERCVDCGVPVANDWLL